MICRFCRLLKMTVCLCSGAVVLFTALLCLYFCEGIEGLMVPQAEDLVCTSVNFREPSPERG